MIIEGLCFGVGFLLVPFSFVGFNRLFFKESLERPFWIIAALLAMISLLITCSIGFAAASPRPRLHLFLLCPLYDLALLRLGIYLFRRRYHRNPVISRVRWSYDNDGKSRDRFFLLVFMLLTLSLPYFILACYYPVAPHAG